MANLHGRVGSDLVRSTLRVGQDECEHTWPHTTMIKMHLVHVPKNSSWYVLSIPYVFLTLFIFLEDIDIQLILN